LEKRYHISVIEYQINQKAGVPVYGIPAFFVVF